jgi:predicted Rossmann fold nucleotide-binding protein DprA/Smf involved in DNA uptake
MGNSEFQFERLEQIVSLAQKITEARDHLDLLITEWNTRFPEVALAGKPQPPSEDSLLAGSIDDRIVNHLDENPDRNFNANTLHDELGVPPSSLGTQLSKLYRLGKIERVGRGYYHSVNRVIKQDEIFDPFADLTEKEAPEGTS